VIRLPLTHRSARLSAAITEFVISYDSDLTISKLGNKLKLVSWLALLVAVIIIVALLAVFGFGGLAWFTLQLLVIIIIVVIIVAVLVLVLGGLSNRHI